MSSRRARASRACAAGGSPRGSADKDTGFAATLWDKLPEQGAYEQSPLYREIMGPRPPFFIGDYKTYHCEVKRTDVVA